MALPPPSVAAVLSATAVLLAGCATSEGGDATMVAATLVTAVAPQGLQVAAVILEYDGELRLTDRSIDPSAFTVTADLSTADGAFTLQGDRTVTSAHPASTADIDAPAEDGRYVILTLDPDDAAASASYTDWDASITDYYELAGGYEVSQTLALQAADGGIAAGAGETVMSSGESSLLIDDYAAGTLTTSAGPTLEYRYLTPATTEGGTYPLVVTLHGLNESGSNNVSQLAGTQISVAFATDASQSAHPAYVLSPQADPSDPAKGGWWDEPMQEAVVELIDDFIATHPDIDTSRVYLTGLSMGSYGSWGILTEHADLFAAAVLVCGGGVADEAVTAAAVADLPIWAVHSEDDFVVEYDVQGSDFRIYEALESAGDPVTWASWSGSLSTDDQEERAAAQARAAEASGSTHLFTTFDEGTTPGLSHFAWIPTYTNDVILDWMFEQRKDL